jgi:hypothetical protein
LQKTYFFLMTPGFRHPVPLQMPGFKSILISLKVCQLSFHHRINVSATP